MNSYYCAVPKLLFHAHTGFLAGTVPVTATATPANTPASLVPIPLAPHAATTDRLPPSPVAPRLPPRSRSHPPARSLYDGGPSIWSPSHVLGSIMGGSASRRRRKSHDTAVPELED